jgi:hypothetical protein
MKRRPLEIGAFNPAPDPLSHAHGVVRELHIYVSPAYTIGLPSSLYVLIARSDRTSCLSTINLRLSEVFFHLQYKMFQSEA